MTKLSNGTIVTDMNATHENTALIAQGYTIRHIETWHRSGHSDTVILWDIPALSEADLPF